MEFQRWVDGVRQEALARGISSQTLDAALAALQPLPEVIELDQRQPEFADTFLRYLDRRVTPERVDQGRELLKKHRKLLARMQKRYGIPPWVLVAFWGLETNYGSLLGTFPVPAALATLAFDPRRSEFYRAQLFDALTLLQAEQIPPQEMRGSWAGAMGQMQFMPSTYLAHAVDADRDGRRDLWNSLPDAFASAANYLRRIGWHPGETWGREVRLPEGFDWGLARPDVQMPVNKWAAMGVMRADGKPLPHSSQSASVLLPQGHKGPAFLVYRNFQAILEWNRSVSYALAVGHLSDRLHGGPALLLGREAEHTRLTREQLMDMQARLNALGYDAGEADGRIGMRSRAAIRLYQRVHGLPEDGYASPELVEWVRASWLPTGSTQPSRIVQTVQSARAPGAGNPIHDPPQRLQ